MNLAEFLRVAQQYAELGDRLSAQLRDVIANHTKRALDDYERPTLEAIADFLWELNAADDQCLGEAGDIAAIITDYLEAWR